MKALDMYISGALLLIAVYLVLHNSGASNDIINNLSKANVGAIKALQGN